jgi:predicted glycoside hydrolase/deacetylase ChbG (UPF0249 family)
VPKRLIINSDDYGLTPEVSRGIRVSHLHGVVTSTTCMMNIPGTAADIAIAMRETPKLGLGVHLVLSADRPLVKSEAVKSITDEKGNFLELAALIERIDQIDVDEVKLEWRTQIEAFVKATDKKPTHLDSHHHISYVSPALFRTMLELAKEFDCGIRLPNQSINKDAPKLLKEFNPRRPDAFFASFYDDRATRDELRKIFNQIDNGTFEIMCHPGYTDSILLETSSYARQRETELEVLTDPKILQEIQENGIQLISFADIK